jgi:hypothetical protein
MWMLDDEITIFVIFTISNASAQIEPDQNGFVEMLLRFLI